MNPEADQTSPLSENNDQQIAGNPVVPDIIQPTAIQPGNMTNPADTSPHESSQPVTSLPQDASSKTAQLYPGLTGSMMQPQKTRLPKGVYVIAGLILIGFTFSFFDTSQNSFLFSIGLFMDLLLGIGLLLRMEAARKMLIIISAALLVLTTASAFLIVGFQSRMASQKAKFEAAVGRLNKENQVSLDEFRTHITAAERQLDRDLGLIYTKLALSGIFHIAVIIYLTRPRVKEAFAPLTE